MSWLLVTEFSYLSPRLHSWLYDLFSPVYALKHRDQRYADGAVTEELFRQPLRQALSLGTAGSIYLDLACGGGRLSSMVLNELGYEGQLTAVDLSAGMLREFRTRLTAEGRAYSFLSDLEQLQTAEPNPQPKLLQADLARVIADKTPYFEQLKGQVNAITLCEVSEFLPDFERVLSWCAELLVPGGLLLLTRPTDPNSWLFWGRQQGRADYRRLASKHGYLEPQFKPWTWCYEVVTLWRQAH